MNRLFALRSVNDFNDYDMDGDEIVSRLEVANDENDASKLVVTVATAEGKQSHRLDRSDVVRLAHFLDRTTE